MNAFMNFSQQHRQDVMDRNPGLSAKILGSMWSASSDEEKDGYKEDCSSDSKSSDESDCGCEEEEEEDEEFCERLFGDHNCTPPTVSSTQQTNGEGSLAAQLGLEVNEAILPDEAINWRPT